MSDFNLNTHQKIKTGFKIPENYFDDLAIKINNKIAQPEVKTISIWKKNKVWIYGMAAVLVLSFSIPFLYNFEVNKVNETEDIENYLAYQSNFTTNEIVEVLEDHSTTTLLIENEMDSKAIEEILIENTDLEHYITN